MFHFIQEITYNMLSEMNLLDMCVQESLRIYPPGQRLVVIQIVLLSTRAINDNFHLHVEVYIDQSIYPNINAI